MLNEGPRGEAAVEVEVEPVGREVALVKFGSPDAGDGDPVMAGNESIKEAPNDDEGLNGFKPVKPVMCDLTGAIVEPCVDGNDRLVVPVG